MAIHLRQFDEYRLHFGHAISERMFRDFSNRMRNADLAGGFLGHLSAHRLGCIFETVVGNDILQQVARQLEQAASFEDVVERTHVKLAPCFGAAHFPADASTAAEVVNVAIAGAMDNEAKSGPSTVLPTSPQPHANGAETNDLTSAHAVETDRRSQQQPHEEDRRQKKPST